MGPLTTNVALPGSDVASTTPVTTPGPPSSTPIEPVVSQAPKAAIQRGGARAFEERLHLWLLRGGLAFVLSYAATSSLLHPEKFTRYLPAFVPDTWATELLPLFAVFEALLVVGLLTDRYTYVASVLAGLTMVAIVAANPHAFDVLFRNVAIACSAFALAVQTRRKPGAGPRRVRVTPR